MTSKRWTPAPIERRLSKGKEYKDLIVGLDIGTSKVAAVIAEIKETGDLEVVGIGQQVSRGMKKGMVVNIDSTVQSTLRALEDAELMAHVKVTHVLTGIAGSHIQSINSHGMVKIKDDEVSQSDISRVIETARALALPSDQKIIHILTREFIIDGQDDVRDPIGMSGMKLEVRVHIITGAASAEQNILKCVKRCGVEVVDLILQPLAASVATLSEDEKELGVCLVDIGGGTTDIAVFKQGSICHTAVIPIAGDQITNDIAVAFHTSTQTAENLKLQYGCALRQLVDAKAVVEVAGADNRELRQLSLQTLAEVVEPRVVELYEFIRDELMRSGMHEVVASGIVITGGGSLMPGMLELGEEVLHLPVRLGRPRGVQGEEKIVRNPRYAAVMGLILMGKEEFVRVRQGGAGKWSLERAWERMKNWF